MSYTLHNAVSLCHLLLESYVADASIVVDMTCGNGHDTLFLRERLTPRATLYAFDIQEAAVQATKKRLQQAGKWDEQVILRQGSHEKLIHMIDAEIDICVFNLGYLPAGNHNIHTEFAITLKALKICLHKLSKKGMIIMAAYPGTRAGAEEAMGVAEFLQQLPQEQYHVSLWQPLNQIHEPPILYIVQRRS